MEQLDAATGAEGGRRKAQDIAEAQRMSAAVWDAMWSDERVRQREFFWFGQEVLLKLDLQVRRPPFASL